MEEPDRRFDVHVDERALSRSGGYLLWTSTPPDRAFLRDAGFHVVDYAIVRDAYFRPALEAPTERATLDNPAQPWLDLLAGHQRVAVLGAPLRTRADLQVIHGLVVEPCFRLDRALVLHTTEPLHAVDPAAVVDEDYKYPWTLQRLRHVAERYALVAPGDGDVPLTPIEAILRDALEVEGRRPVPQFGVSRMRVDFAFPAEGLVVECDGRAWHDAQRDARRDEVLAQLGWKVLRLTGSEIVRDPAACARRVGEAMDELAADPTRLSPATAVPAETPDIGGWWARVRAWLRRTFLREQESSAAVTADATPVRAAEDGRRLDIEQERAVVARDGVVQIIAPAGSGKTTVLVERVRELRARGVPANRILCTTFNRKAVDELKERLTKAGVGGIEVRTFHGLGRMICCSEQLFRSDALCAGSGPGPFELSAGMWARLAGQAAEHVGRGAVTLDVGAAKDTVSALKLGLLLDPEEARIRAGDKPAARTAAELYRLYEEQAERRDGNDYDDFLLLAVRRLREDAAARERWQGRWEYVLVDEYQDIEPAQATLVQLLAAPEDNLFCVGDEDQTLYAWRRASVDTVVGLDRRYLGLERVALAHNYRCPAEVVRRSRALIEHNRIRFPKAIEPAPNRAEEADGAVRALHFDDQGRAAVAAAELVRDARRGEVVILARATRHLRDVALACADAGVAIDCPERVLKLAGALDTVQHYAAVFAALPGSPDPESLRRMFRTPNRYLSDRAAVILAGHIAQGASFAEAVERLRPAEAWMERKLGEGARIFDALAREPDAERWLRTLRTRGGLDRHYSEQDKLTHASDTSDLDDLDQLAQAARGKTVAELAAHLQRMTLRLRGAFDPKHGIELNTIHGAKGREWAHAIVFAADDDVMPASRALSEAAGGKRRLTPSAGPDDPTMRAALEDERRIAYVAFTRAAEHLTILCCRPSRFLAEADGIVAVAGEPRDTVTA